MTGDHFMVTLCRLDVFLLFTFLNIISNSRLEAGRYAEAKEAADGAMSIFKRLPTDTLSTTKEQIEAVNELHEQLSVI